MRVAKNPNWKLIMRKYRENNFAVKVEWSHSPLFEDEASLEMTHNGYQSFVFSMNKKEAVKIIKAIRNHFKI